MEYKNSPEAARDLLAVVRLMKLERSKVLQREAEIEFQRVQNNICQLDALEVVGIMLNNGPALARILRSTR